MNCLKAFIWLSQPKSDRPELGRITSPSLSKMTLEWLRGNYGMPSPIMWQNLQRGRSFTCKDAAKSTITPLRLISWLYVCQRLVSPTILLISKKNHPLIKKNCGNIWRKWFSRLKIKSGSGLYARFTANTIRNSILTPQRKPITMLLNRDLLFTQLLWSS